MRGFEFVASGQAGPSANLPVEPAVPSGWPYSVCPNFSEWLPGDIVLVRSNGGLRHRVIEYAQRASINRATRDGSAYVRAALYVDSGEIVDITTSLGVARRSVWTYCEHHAITLRRLCNLSMSQRNDIVQVANSLAASAQSYSWWELALSKPTPHPDKLFCSTLVGHAVQKACGVQLHALPIYRPLYPGTLAEHQGLNMVELEWRRV